MTSLSARTVYTLPSRLGKTMCGEPAKQTTLPELHPSRLLAHWVDQNSHGLDVRVVTQTLVLNHLSSEGNVQVWSVLYWSKKCLENEIFILSHQ